jgi:pentapeptide repeat protein
VNRWRADWVKWSEAKKHLRQREDRAAEKEARAAEKEARAAEKEARAAEKEARASDVVSNKKEEWNLPLQVIGLAVAMLVVLATAWAAYEARKAVITSQHIASQQVKDSRDIVLQQSAENKFTMAVTAISSKDPLQQVAGFMLLHSSVREEVNGAINNPSWRPDAYDAYVTSMYVIHVYLRGASTAGRNPPLPALSASQTLNAMLVMGPAVQHFGVGPPPTIDLSHAALPGVNWDAIRVDLLARLSMAWIDLRGASLRGSYWGAVDLEHANLQCANLEGADLKRADLRGADLRGADLRGAVLPSGAALRGVLTAGAVGPAIGGLRIVHPGTSYQLRTCRAAKYYPYVPNSAGRPEFD